MVHSILASYPLFADSKEHLRINMVSNIPVHESEVSLSIIGVRGILLSFSIQINFLQIGGDWQK